MDFKCSYFQERTWLEDASKMDGRSSDGLSYYNIPILFEIDGILNIQYLRKALHTLIEKHEAIRTYLVMKDEGLTQAIQDQFEPILDIYDWTGSYKTKEDAVPFLKEINKKVFQNGIGAQLFKSCYLKLNDKISYLMLSMHRSICDEISKAILKKDIISFYQAIEKNGEPEYEEAVFQYADYSEWLNELPDDIVENEVLYWKRKLKKGVKPLILPGACENTSNGEYNSQVYTISLKQSLVEKADQLHKEYSFAKEDIFLAVLKILLAKYTGEQDISIGTSFSNRDQQELADTVGPISNLVILSDELNQNSGLTDIIRQVQETRREAAENSLTPFDRIMKEIIPGNNTSTLDSVNILFNYMKNEEISSDFKEIELNLGWGKYDYNLLIKESESDTKLYLTYNSCYYNEYLAEQLLKSFVTISEELLSEPHKAIINVEYVCEDEKELLLNQWNNTGTGHLTEDCVHDIFSKIAKEYPDNIAVQYEKESITYGELEKSSNQIANWFKNHGIEKEDIIAIIMDRNIHTIELMLGVLKAGACYLTIEPDAPVERKQYILDDSLPKFLIVEEANPKAENGNVIFLKDLLNEKESMNTEFCSTCDNSCLAYIIYTSGTTGKPKGVMVEHRNLARLIQHGKDLFDFTVNDVWSMFHSYSFDFSVWEIYGALLTGGRVVVIPRKVSKDTAQFREYLVKYGVTVLSQTPTAFNALVNEEDTHEVKEMKVRYIVFGGEALRVQNLVKWRESYARTIFINMYGITETTVHVTFKKVTDEEIKKSIDSIGVPLPNYQVYILDQQQKLVPVGVKGEICVGGSGVARGYLKKQELTEQKFIANPFGEGKLYRSGDLARWLPNGELEYLGRMDDQIKIRGFRIELGEIENVIKCQDGIQDAAVIAREKDGENYILAYIVSEDQINLSALRNSLENNLPGYMIPSFIMQIDKIPMTGNGKLDKKALPQIEAKSEKEYAAPGNEIEEIFVRIFEEVLGMERVGIKDDFFEIGGHSLKATKVINRIEAATGVRLSLLDIFNEPTIEGLSKKIKAKDKKYSQIPKAEVKELYPMSSAQKRIFVICSSDSSGVLYNMFKGMEFNGKLDAERVNEVFNQLIKRHEMLRTSFFMNNGEAVQKISEEISAEIEYVEIDQADEEAREKLLDDFVRPFDLGKAPLMRFKVVRVKKGNDLLFFDMHHIISDGMSINIISEEFAELYSGVSLEPLEIQYKDYSEWMRTRDIKEQKIYWINEFKDDIPVLNLPLDHKRPQLQSYKGNCVESLIESDLKEKIEAFCRETGTTEYMVLLSGLMILLSKYSRQEDIIVGSPISGRVNNDTEKILGMFVNTLAMRGAPSGEKSFIEFLKEMKQKCLKAQQNQEYPFDELVEEVEVNRDLSRNPLFDVVFSFENAIDDTEFEIEGLSFTDIEIEHVISKFDLTVTATKKADCFGVSFEYCSDLFDEDSIHQMAGHFNNILKEVILHPEWSIEDIEVVDEEEKEKITKQFNDTDAFYPKNKTVIDLFEEQAARVPDKIAVAFGEQKITYRELNQKANQLAVKLSGLGVKPDDFVAIIAERRIETVIGICGILKAGGAYAPIDPAYPQERVDYILEDCQPKALLLYNTEYKSKLPLIDLSDAVQWEGVKEKPKPFNKPCDLIYLIYTSGTTGKPKGTMIENKSVLRLVLNVNYVELNEKTVILQTGALSFDASTFEIWGALLNGGRVYIGGNDVILDAKALKEVIKKNSINTMFITTALYNQLINLDETVFDGLEALHFGGEKTSEIHVRKLTDNNKKIHFSNIYGPTETTTFATWYPINDKTLREKTPIGKPISNTKVYVLNRLKLCGTGMAGELCIAGDGVARGYLNHPELTAEKFIDNPFGEGKLYRTGDVARWLPDGNIEFLGRVDEQIKLRGFRIELAEIENAVRKLKDISDVVVIVSEEQEEKSICAYLIMEQDMEIGYIRDQLRKELPDYMIPAYMMKIDKIPVNRNGKVDRKALPKIEVKSEHEYVAPSTEEESSIVKVFEEILGVGKVGIKDSFYELGGDSIKAIRIVSQLRELGFELTIKDIMQIRIIEDIVSKVRKNMNADEYEQGELVGEVPLTPIQGKFFKWNLSNPNHFNQSVMLKSKDGFEEGAVFEVLRALVAHHDILRAVFENGRQRIRSTSEKNLFTLEKFDFRDQDESSLAKLVEAKNTEMQSSIDIANGPLLKAAVYQTSECDHLMLCIHHLVVDGVSWRILLEDIAGGYAQYAAKKQIAFPRKTASYLQWSKELLEYSNSEELKSEIGYWTKIIKETEAGKIEGDVDGREKGKGSTVIEFSEEKTGALVYEAGKAYNTEINDILISALGLAVYSWKNQKVIALNLEGHGREEINKAIDINRTVGWFTSIYPIIVEASGNIEEVIVKTKEMLRHIPNHGMGYGVIQYCKKYGISDVETDMCFNYLGQWDNEAKTATAVAVSELSGGINIAAENKMSNSISVNGNIVGGKLIMTIEYDKSKFGKESIEKFSEHYKKALNEIIEFCTTKEGSVKTASDYYEELTDDILQDIMSNF